MSPAQAASQQPNPQPAKTPGAANARVSKDAEAEAELEKTLAASGNDSAAIVRNLKSYLARYPDSPRKPAVFRAIVEACQQVRDANCALDYAERLIALRPDDSDMMLLAANLLQQRGTPVDLTHAADYVTRVLDRTEKAIPIGREARESEADWRAGQDQLRAVLYYVRGKIEATQRDDDEAVKDLTASYHVRPNALAAEALGEIAESRRDYVAAAGEYALAFVLPEAGPAGTVDRRTVWLKLSNAWKLAHGDTSGLGDAILAAYDRGAAQGAREAKPAPRNPGAKDMFDFVLRRLDGTLLPLDSLQGKIAALSFWATWCGPCRDMEPQFNRVAKAYQGNPNVAFFAISSDEDESQVAPFLAREKWDLPVLYADGLDDFLKVETLPAVLVISPTGEIIYRVDGLPPDGIEDSLAGAIQKALRPAN